MLSTTGCSGHESHAWRVHEEKHASIVETKPYRGTGSCLCLVIVVKEQEENVTEFVSDRPCLMI